MDAYQSERISFRQMILPTNRQGEWDIRAESSLLGKEIRGTGQTSFMERTANASYSKEFKVSCVLTALRGEGSVDDIVVKYNISSHSVLRHWIKQYQERFGVRTPMEVRVAGLNAKIPEQFLIAENKRIQKYNAKFVA